MLYSTLQDEYAQELRNLEVEYNSANNAISLLSPTSSIKSIKKAFDSIEIAYDNIVRSIDETDIAYYASNVSILEASAHRSFVRARDMLNKARA